MRDKQIQDMNNQADIMKKGYNGSKFGVLNEEPDSSKALSSRNVSVCQKNGVDQSSQTIYVEVENICNRKETFM